MNLRSYVFRLSLYVGLASLALIVVIVLNPSTSRDALLRSPGPSIAAEQSPPPVLPRRPTEATNPPPQIQGVVANAEDYPWLDRLSMPDLLANRFAPPRGFARSAPSQGSFGYWLQRLPLKTGRPDVLLYTHKPKGNQQAHAAVIDIPTGNTDLQQCADAIIRLRAEYLFARGEQASIRFNFTSGDRAEWTKWSLGERPTVKGRNVTWRRTARSDASYASFAKYLQTVFTYAGTSSLERELRPVAGIRDIQIGDVFIHGGSPGHAEIVVDLAQDSQGRKVFLLVQSFMPAQDMHVLRNLQDSGLSPWYSADFGGTLNTPQWNFKASELRRFP